MNEPLYKKIKPIIEQSQQQCCFCLPETNLLKCDEQAFMRFGLLSAFAESLFGKKEILEVAGAPLYAYTLYALLNLPTEEKITYSYIAMPSIFNRWILLVQTSRKTFYCDLMNQGSDLLIAKEQLEPFLVKTAIRTVREEEKTYKIVTAYEGKLKKGMMDKFKSAYPPEYSSIQSRIESHEKDMAAYRKKHNEKIHIMERLIFSKEIKLQQVFSITSDDKEAFQSQLHSFVTSMSLDESFQGIIEQYLKDLNLNHQN